MTAAAKMLRQAVGCINQDRGTVVLARTKTMHMQCIIRKCSMCGWSRCRCLPCGGGRVCCCIPLCPCVEGQKPFDRKDVPNVSKPVGDRTRAAEGDEGQEYRVSFCGSDSGSVLVGGSMLGKKTVGRQGRVGVTKYGGTCVWTRWKLLDDSQRSVQYRVRGVVHG